MGEQCERLTSAGSNIAMTLRTGKLSRYCKTARASRCRGYVSGVTVTAEVPCIYPSGSFGELAADMTGLLAQKKSDATPLSLEDDTAPEFYVTGNLGSDPSTVRNFGSDVPGLTRVRPYSGNAREDITNYLAARRRRRSGTWRATTGPKRQYSGRFAKPDYFGETRSPSRTKVTGSNNTEFICQDTADGWNREFGKDALEADTAAVEGTSTCDGTYFSVVSSLSVLDQDRDQLAGAMKSELEVSEFQNHPDYCFARSDRGLSVTHQQGGGPRSVARCSRCRGTPCGGIGRPVG